MAEKTISLSRSQNRINQFYYMLQSSLIRSHTYSFTHFRLLIFVCVFFFLLFRHTTFAICCWCAQKIKNYFYILRKIHVLFDGIVWLFVTFELEMLCQCLRIYLPPALFWFRFQLQQKIENLFFNQLFRTRSCWHFEKQI